MRVIWVVPAALPRPGSVHRACGRSFCWRPLPRGSCRFLGPRMRRSRRAASCKRTGARRVGTTALSSRTRRPRPTGCHWSLLTRCQGGRGTRTGSVDLPEAWEGCEGQPVEEVLLDGRQRPLTRRRGGDPLGTHWPRRRSETAREDVGLYAVQGFREEGLLLAALIRSPREPQPNSMAAGSVDTGVSSYGATSYFTTVSAQSWASLGRAARSLLSALSDQRSFVPTQSAPYVHWAEEAGGNHSVGSRSCATSRPSAVASRHRTGNSQSDSKASRPEDRVQWPSVVEELSESAPPKRH